MGQSTAIGWTDATFNPWWGCTKVSPGCDHCYAEVFAKRVGQRVWGAGESRRFFDAKHWAEPLRWNRKAEASGVRLRVFCGSMCDWADNEVDQSVRERLFALIRETPWLDWQLLTKRIGNVPAMLPADWCLAAYQNCWLGITVVNQEEANRDIPKLADIPAPIRFLSIEPQLSGVDLEASGRFGSNRPREIDWVIVGGESGHHARSFNVWWARQLITQCEAARVACFVKQLGARPFTREVRDDGGGCLSIFPVERIKLKHHAGADPSEWPEDLRVQEFPAPCPNTCVSQ